MELNEMTEQTKISQKAQALAQYTEAYNNYVIDQTALGWKPLQTVRVDMPLGPNVDMDVLVSAHVDRILSQFGPVPEQPLFIRVCPLQPRPGVLESLPVYSKEGLRENLERLINVMLGPDPAEVPLYDHGLCEPDGCIIV